MLIGRPVGRVPLEGIEGLGPRDERPPDREAHALRDPGEPPPMGAEERTHPAPPAQSEAPVQSGILLDPLTRVLAAPTRPAATSSEPLPAAPPLPAELEKLMLRLVRRVALGGDGRRTSARIEIGAGELAGATVTVHAERHELMVEIDLPSGIGAERFRERIEERLLGRGLELRELVVR
jgi:hypothetical protein